MRPVVFQVRTDSGDIYDVREGSPVWAKLQHAPPGSIAVVAGLRYEKLGEAAP